MPGPASNDQPIAPDATQEALKSRLQIALFLLVVTLVIAIVYLVGWSIQLLVLLLLTSGVGYFTVLFDRRRRRLAPSGVDQVEAPAGVGGAELRSLAQRSRFLLIFLISVLIDVAFLAVWAFLSLLVSRFFDKLGSLGGLDGQSLDILEWVFRVSTLIPIAAYVAWDLIRAISHIWASPRDSSDQ